MLLIELLCPSCSQQNCKNHVQSIIKKDLRTGLEFQIRCDCTNHFDLRKEGKID